MSSTAWQMLHPCNRPDRLVIGAADYITDTARLQQKLQAESRS